LQSGIDPVAETPQGATMSGFVRRVPESDHRERMICADCGHIDYQNPKIVVGAVVVSQGAVLLCRHAIEPRVGFWSLAAGYLELGETLEEGATREIWEEGQARIMLEGILGIFSISRIGQVHVMFRALLSEAGARPHFAAGAESLEAGLFPWDRTPWDNIAFPSTRWTLDAWRRSGIGPLGAPAGNPADDARGTKPLVMPPAASS
jgi:ADP-ribose pyrophosphatase YjhB (NUDIX family)